MHVHDQEPGAEQKRPETRRAENDAAWQIASRAVATGDGRVLGNNAAVLRLQRLAGNAGVGSLVGQEPEESDESDEARSPVLDVVGKGGGSPLPADVRSEMEAHLGADFGDVRVHDSGAAAESARAVQAKAYTVGNELVFNSGEYQPGTDEGRRTLAHELTHVVQQRAGPVEATPAPGGIAVSHPSDRFEQAAEESAMALQRQEAPEEEEEEEVQPLALQRQEGMPEEEEEEEVTGL